MLFHRLIRLTTLLALGALASFAQQIPPMSGALYEKPAKASAPTAVVRPPSRALSLRPPVVAALAPLAAEEMSRVQGRQGSEAVGVHRLLPAPFAALSAEAGPSGSDVAGAWEQTNAGPIWRLQVLSRDAFAMRVHFHSFQVGEGRVWVHADDGQVAGPYSGTGLFENGDFWSDVVFGESMTIEYQPAAGSAGTGAVPFEVREVSHVWRDPRALQAGAPSPPWPALQSPQSEAGPKSIGPQTVNAAREPVEQEAACHLDVTCSPEWAQTARGVGMIVYEADGGTRVCSGSMLNTRGSTFEPYFLTAAHCLKTETVARTVISFWGFQSATCNAPPPELRDVERTSGGARVLSTLGDFNDPKGDMTFLQILGEIPSGVFFQGWNPARQPFGTRVTGIHHPRGTAKRISSGPIVPDQIFDTDSQVYALVNETAGRTERGSSGSAIFSRPGVVVGALSFGLKTDDVCAINPSPAGYTHFSVIYPEISQFLESDTAPPPPPEPPSVLLSGQAVRFELGPVTSGTLFSGSTSYVLEVPGDATRVTLTMTSDTPSLDADLHARYDRDTSVSGGNVQSDYGAIGNTGNESIVIDASSSPPLRAGTLFVSIAVYGTGAVSRGSLIANVETAPPPPPPSGETLISGQPTGFDLPPVAQSALFGGASSYRIDVPAGATQLDVRIDTATPGVDVDLHLRRDVPPDLLNSRVVADLESTGLSGAELVTLTPENGLAPGTYYAALSVYTENVRVRGEIRADIALGNTPLPDGARLLSSGEAGRFNLPAVDGPSFFTDLIYAVDVPAGANRLVVDLITETPGVDVDLYVRLGQPPAIEDRRVVANYEAEGLTGAEQIVIDGSSQPPLQAGRYFFAVAVYTAGLASTGRVVATVGAGPPTVQLTAVTNAASFEQGVVAPGQIVSLFGSRLGPSQGAQPGLDASGRVPTFVEGTIVLFGGVPAPLFFVRQDQINAQVPYDVAGRGTVDVVIVSQGVTTNVLQVQVRDAAPALFMFQDGSNRVIAVNSDGSLNSPSNPARRGDFVTLYATGGGLTSGPNEEGLPAPSSPLALTRLPVRVRFGGVEQIPFFAGLAPGFAGLTQINVFVPENGPTGGAVPVALIIGGFGGGVQPTISVQ